MDNMTDDLLKNFIPKVDCMDNNCSVRYYNRDGGIALGIIRFTITNKTTGKVPQQIIVINSMDLDSLIGYIMGTNNISPNMGEYVVHLIRSHATGLVRSHLFDHTSHTE